MCRSAVNTIKVEGTIITFEGGDRADFGQVAEGCVRRAEADVKDYNQTVRITLML